MSFEIQIDPKSRVAGRLIGQVRRTFLEAALREFDEHGLTQASIAKAMDVDRSVINRLLKGRGNLTVRTLGELAWALGLEPCFELKRPESVAGDNNLEEPVPARLMVQNSNKSHSPAGSVKYYSPSPKSGTTASNVQIKLESVA